LIAHAKAARSSEKIKELIETGFEYIT